MNASLDVVALVHEFTSATKSPPSRTSATSRQSPYHTSSCNKTTSQLPKTRSTTSKATEVILERYSRLLRPSTRGRFFRTNVSKASSDPNSSRIDFSTKARSAGSKHLALRQEKPASHCCSSSETIACLKGEKELGQSRDKSKSLSLGASSSCISCILVKVASSYTHQSLVK